MEEENKEKVEKAEDGKAREEMIIRKVGDKFAISIMTALLSGLSVGFMLGMIFAPMEGKKTRKEIADRSLDLYKKGEKTFKDAYGKTKDFAVESLEKFDMIKDIIIPKEEKEKQDDNKS
jgi:gas vesicle protein